MRRPFLLAGLCTLTLVILVSAKERQRWEHSGGHFEKVAPGKWIEKSREGTFEFVEVTETPKFIELFDKKRNVTVRLMDNLLAVKMGKAAFKTTSKGKWVAVPLVKKDDPPKDDAKKDDGKDKDPKAAAAWTEISMVLGPTKIGVYDIGVSPDGKQCVMNIGSPFSVELGVIDFETKKVAKRWKTPSVSPRIIWSADGATLAAILPGEIKKDAKSQIALFDTKTWEQRDAFEMAGFPSAMALSSDGKTLAAATATGVNPGVLLVWDTASKKELFRAETGSIVRIAMTADGKTLAAKGIKVGLVLLDLPSGKERLNITANNDFVLAADGKTLVEMVWGSEGMLLNVWDLTGPAKTPRVIKGGKWRPESIALLNDGRHAAVGGGLEKDEIRMLSAHRTKAPGRTMMLVRATPDSTRLVSYGTDKDIRLWKTGFSK
jgi:hypothetical protein